jgi:hypothetical protein
VFSLFFNELPPVKVDLVEKPAACESLSVPCAMQKHDVRTAKKQHLRVCRCLKNGMDMGAVTILSMTIIAWAFLPVNRNAVPVCVICAPIHCHVEITWYIMAKLVEKQML